ncbi:DNA polymerase [uncultured Planococcus sp.]|uniref:DNA polymerase n=1 Tax=uncultured Planococcus sp. TaxID=337815 RepID=UPI002631644C|nr:DNA polymerase [uncultured Planococcus sp.]
MELKLTLNDASNDRLQAAAVKRTAHVESLDEAWLRILAMKNAAPDQAKLLAVRDAMAGGQLGRAPTSAGKRFSKAEALRMYKELAALQRESKLAAMVEGTPANYVLVLDEQTLANVIRDAFAESVIAVDTETTGLDVFVDVIVGVSITTPSTDRHYYIPCTPTKDERVLPADVVLAALKPLLEDAAVGKVFHNAIYDINMFKRHGIELRGLAWDTQPAMALLNENEPSFALKRLATNYLGEPSDTFAELFGKGAQFADVPLDIALVYGAKDTDITWRLYEFQRLHLAKMPKVLDYYLTVEVPLIEAVIAMERTGFDIDVKYAREYGITMQADIARLEGELHDALGGINLNSPPQLKEALERVTGQKLESTDAKRVLKPLGAKYPIIANLLKYKELTKLYSTYISVLPEKIHPVTGKLHARFNANGTVTGRFSSGGNGVNLQNQPYDARKLFVAPDGYVIVGADFKAQEIRCAANKSREPVLIDAFADGVDPYALLAAKHFKKPYDECYKNPDGSDTVERKTMKVVMLAVLYGMGSGTLSSSLKITMDEARKFLADFFVSYPAIDAWIKETQTFAKRNGYVWIGDGKRKRRLPEAKRKTTGYVPEVQRALRQGPNAQIQGESAIQTKTTLINLHRLCQERGWRLYATIHDEMLVLMPEDFTPADIAAYEAVMIDSYQFGDVPNGTDIEVARRWGEGVPVDEWFKQRKSKEAIS